MGNRFSGYKSDQGPQQRPNPVDETHAKANPSAQDKSKIIAPYYTPTLTEVYTDKSSSTRPAASTPPGPSSPVNRSPAAQGSRVNATTEEPQRSYDEELDRLSKGGRLSPQQQYQASQHPQAFRGTEEQRRFWGQPPQEGQSQQGQFQQGVSQQKPQGWDASQQSHPEQHSHWFHQLGPGEPPGPRKEAVVEHDIVDETTSGINSANSNRRLPLYNYRDSPKGDKRVSPGQQNPPGQQSPPREYPPSHLTRLHNKNTNWNVLPSRTDPDSTRLHEIYEVDAPARRMLFVSTGGYAGAGREGYFGMPTGRQSSFPSAVHPEPPPSQEYVQKTWPQAQGGRGPLQEAPFQQRESQEQFKRGPGGGEGGPPPQQRAERENVPLGAAGFNVPPYQVGMVPEDHPEHAFSQERSKRGDLIEQFGLPREAAEVRESGISQKELSEPSWKGADTSAYQQEINKDMRELVAQAGGDKKAGIPNLENMPLPRPGERFDPSQSRFDSSQSRMDFSQSRQTPEYVPPFHQQPPILPEPVPHWWAI